MLVTSSSLLVPDAYEKNNVDVDKMGTGPSPTSYSCHHNNSSLTSITTIIKNYILNRKRII